MSDDLSVMIKAFTASQDKNKNFRSVYKRQVQRSAFTYDRPKQQRFSAVPLRFGPTRKIVVLGLQPSNTLQEFNEETKELSEICKVKSNMDDFALAV
jgi:hypothetical protein